LNVEAVKTGGDNGVGMDLPARTSFSDLVLKRGMLPSTSALTKWCYSWLLNDYSTKIEKKNVYLYLYNESATPILTWLFLEAFPIKLEIGKFDAMSSAIVVETITLRYKNIQVITT